MRYIDFADFVASASTRRHEFHQAYFAMYSSVFGGIVTDPVLMLIPADDHLVHRGDGVFETLKCVSGRIYNMQAHMERLVRSAAAVDLSLPEEPDGIARTAGETVRAGGRRECGIRVLVSRGPGSFGVNPRDCPASQLYVVAYRLGRPFMESHPQGARVRITDVPLKPPRLACAKVCNYVPNALMKKEAADAGADFAIAFDERGCLAEGAAENVGIVTRKGALLFPRPDRVLAGTTMLRVMDLASGLVRDGRLSDVAFADISREMLMQAAEVLIVGTSPDVTAVREIDGAGVGAGRPGPVYAMLSRELCTDMQTNDAVLTAVFDDGPPG
jgi:branched-chain amino acid aminotransferase